MALDKRINFKSLTKEYRLRVIQAIKWLKTHDITGTASATGGRYQQYVDWYSSTVKVDYRDKFDYIINIPLANINDNDQLVSISFDNLNPIEPSLTTFLKDHLGLIEFLNNLFAHSLHESFAAEVIGHPSALIPEKVAVFSVSDDGTNLIISCPNCPFVLESLDVTLLGTATTLPFVQTVRSVDNKWRLSNQDVAHASCAFLPWNRAFIRLFEQDLKIADDALGNNGKIALPYWSWAIDNSLEGERGYLWKDEDDVFGGDGNATSTAPNRLESGPFKHTEWILYNSPQSFITRKIGRSVVDGKTDPWKMPSKPDVDSLMDRPTYDVYPFNELSSRFSFRNTLEGWYGLYTNVTVEQPSQMYNAVNLWVGGTLSNARYSVNDPVFFLIMCNVDRIWSIWQKKTPAPVSQYPAYGPLPGIGKQDQMLPWASVVGYSNPITPEDVLDWQKFPSPVNAVLGSGYKYK